MRRCFILLIALATVTYCQTRIDSSPVDKNDRPQSAPSAPIGDKTGRFVVGFDRSLRIERLGKRVVRIGPNEALVPIIGKQDEFAARLRKLKGVRFVMPSEVLDGNRSSLTSVRAHLQYLYACRDLEEKGTAAETEKSKGLRPRGDSNETRHEKEGRLAEETEFYEHLMWFLQYRVNGNGVIDPQGYERAMAQRDRLPSARLTPGNFSVSGNWGFIGPRNLAVPYQRFYGSTPPLSGRITAIAYGTSEKVIYAGTGGGGIWKSADGGLTWSCITDSTGWIYSAVSSLAVDPTNRNVIYAGTGDYDGFHNYYTFGIMKSSDGGLTWTNYGRANFGDQTVSHIVIDPEHHNIVTLTTGHGATNFYGGNIWQSTDSGVTWAKVSSAIDSAYSSVDIGQWFGSRLYVAAGAANNGVLLYGSNSSSTGVNAWGELNTPIQTQELHPYTASSKVDHDIFYLLGSDNHKIYITGPNAGASWYDLTEGVPSMSDDGTQDNWSQSGYDYVIGLTFRLNNSAPSDDMLYLGEITMGKARVVLDPMAINPPSWTWQDIGKTYDETGAIVHNDQHCVAQCPFNNNEVMIGCDGGLFKYIYNPTTDSGTFTSLNANLGNTQFYAMAAHPTDPNQVLGGTQDNASPVAEGNLSVWQNLQGGDGGACAYDTVHNLRYTTANNHLFEYEGASAVDIHAPLTKRVSAVVPMVLAADGSPITADYRMMIYDGLSWSVAGPGASQDLTFGGTSWVRTLATCPYAPKVVYTGSADGTIWRTDDLGETQANWHRIDGNFFHPSGGAIPIGAICPSPNNYKDILVAIGSAGVSTHLCRCADTTAATPVWTIVDQGGANDLPNVPVNAVLRDPYDPDNSWYVATDIGVFVTRDGGLNWSNMTAPLKLPNTIIMDLKYGAGFLYAATFGRGIWRIALSDSPGLEGISLNEPSVVGGGKVTGEVVVSHVPTLAMTVPLTSSRASAAAPPSSTTVPVGSLDGPFTVSTYPVTADTEVTVQASLNGVRHSVNLLVKAPLPASLVFDPSEVPGGVTGSGDLSLTGTAPTGGVTVALVSGNPAIAQVPASVTVLAGARNVLFPVTTANVKATTNVVIQATKGSARITGELTVQFAPLTALTLSPASVYGGNPLTGTLVFRAAVPTAFSASVTSNNSGIVPFIGAIPVAVGATSKSFNISTNGVAVVTRVVVTATAGASARSSSVSVYPSTVAPFSPSAVAIIGGQMLSAKVLLSGGAPPAGAKVTLKSDNAALVVPPIVTINYDLHSQTFSATSAHVAAATTCHIVATYLGVPQTLTVTLNP